jgi:hypothetical protein
MTVHTFSDKDPTCVTGADVYKVTATKLLLPDHPDFEALQELFPSEHRRSEGYGLAYLESEEHYVLYVGPVDQIVQLQTVGGQLDVAKGVIFDTWLSNHAWVDFNPDTTWNEGGQGIVTEFDHPLGGKVIVFEYLHDWKGATSKMVTWHCERCHRRPDVTDFQENRTNFGPMERSAVARRARRHLRDHATACRPVNPRFAEVVSQVGNSLSGRDDPTVTWESLCSVNGPCSQIRHFRART